jgi:peptidoglycan hydrolase-like protein with peptidoglycan-binding domain
MQILPTQRSECASFGSITRVKFALCIGRSFCVSNGTVHGLEQMFPHGTCVFCGAASRCVTRNSEQGAYSLVGSKGRTSGAGGNSSKEPEELGMRKQLLLSTAALLAGIAVASAQGPIGGMTGGAKNPGAAAGHEQPATQGRSSEPQQRVQEHGRTGQPQRSEENEHRTTGQATPGAKEPAAKEKEPGRAGEHAQGKPSGKPSAAPGEHERTTGQAPRSEPGRNPAQTQNRPSPSEGAAPQHEPQQTESKAPSREGQAPSPQQARPAQPQPGQPQQAERRPAAGGNVRLSSEQQTHIRETILSRGNAPRVDNVSIALNVGTVVPRDVRIVAVPEELIAIKPQWRGDEYFIVRDEIVIVDRGHRIVAVLPMGSGPSQATGPSRTRPSGSLTLSTDEIRQLQIALNEKGFNIGEPDGRMGPRTERALMEFQQRQGLQATGHIDHETVTALGINVREQQGGRTTGEAPAAGTEPGRAGNMPQQPSANEQPMRNEQRNPGRSEPPATSGQSRPMQPPSAKPGATANPPASPGASPRTGEGTREQRR